MSPMIYDYVIIGGGIVGLSTAWQLQQRLPKKKILLLEKEADFARHQSGHNSGVLHAGIYYPPGSLKARFCKAGVAATVAFCRANDIAFEQCGKLLVATDDSELQRMQALYQRARENKLEVALLGRQQLQRREPHIEGCGAIYVKDSGIVDYPGLCQALARRFTELGGQTRLQAEVVALQESTEAITVSLKGEAPLTTRFLVSCAGLHADRVTRMLAIPTDFRIVPYRGEYYRLPARLNRLVRHLIYPIPDPALPFLGVHLTRMIDGSITVGPNAVQGWKREGYGRINVSLKDSWEMLSYRGWWKVTAQHLSSGLGEWRDSWWKRGYLRRVQKYCPSLQLADLQPYPAGIRAQAVRSDGSLVHDFLFAHSRRSLHVCNAPSPAATSALPIGAYICDKLSAAAPAAG